jgi:phenylacetate-CoA ligase
MFRDALIIHRSLRLLPQLRRRLAWSREQLQQHQLSALQRLVRHAYEHTDLYRQLFDKAGVKPADLRTLDDFSHWPTVDKQTLRDAFPHAAIARGTQPSRLVTATTSGSTGEPLRFVLDVDTVAHKIAGNWRSMELAGYRVGRDRLLQFSPDGRVVGQWARHLGDLLVRRWCLDPLSLDCAQAVTILRRVQPTVLFGWTSYLRTLAQYLIERGQQWPVRSVIATSEMLRAEDRELIGRAFAAPVYDQYGSTEFGRLATEHAGSRGLLINADLAYLETCGAYDAEDGVVGELLVTSLVNFAMPFIRYRIGDLGRFASATTASFPAFPRLERLDGRVQDMLRRPDGTPVMPQFVHRVLREFEEIDRYQVIQHTASQCEVRLRMRSPLTATRAEDVRRRFTHQLGGAVVSLSCGTEFVTKTGKLQQVISYVC